MRALINAGKAWVIAYQEGVPVSEYVREMVHDHILQTGARFRETGARLRALSNAVKVWLIAYHECVAVRIHCVAHCVLHNISKRYRIESRRYRFAIFLENSLCRVVLRMSGTSPRALHQMKRIGG
ncbi:MAG: hypothetical protein ABSG74_09705 [Candidatus Bathyarchaeia archaeon]